MPSLPFPGLPFRLERCGVSRVGPEWSKPRFSFPHHRIYWVKAGEAWLGEGHGQGLTLRPGKLYLVPGFAHTVSRCETFLDHAWVNFTGQPGALGTAFENGFTWKEVAAGKGALSATFQAIIRFKKGATGDGELPCELGLAASAALLALLARLYEGHPPTHVLPRSRFRPLLEHLEAHLSEPLDVSAWATRAGLDPVYYANAFSTEIGIPPHQWLIRRRLERAQEMLWEADRSVRAISRAVGFQDESYFSRLFRKKVGMTPRAYRQRRVE